MKLGERFWSKVNRSGRVVRPELGPCWEWTAGTVNRYGLFWVGGRRGMARASRVVHESIAGPIPAGHDICHRCDNPPYVRPEHLFLGTRADNVRDMLNKGRARGGRLCGEANPGAKLTESVVIAIRGQRAAGSSLSEVARAFGIPKATIAQISSRRSWRHV